MAAAGREDDRYAPHSRSIGRTTPSGPDTIRAFYPGRAADPVWEIRPLRGVTLTGANCVLAFDRPQAGLEDLQAALVPSAVEGTTAGNFLVAVGA